MSIPEQRDSGEHQPDSGEKRRLTARDLRHWKWVPRYFREIVLSLDAYLFVGGGILVGLLAEYYRKIETDGTIELLGIAAVGIAALAVTITALAIFVSLVTDNYLRILAINRRGGVAAFLVPYLSSAFIGALTVVASLVGALVYPALSRWSDAVFLGISSGLALWAVWGLFQLTVGIAVHGVNRWTDLEDAYDDEGVYDDEDEDASDDEGANGSDDASTTPLDRTLAEQRTRTLNERFATAAEQLGSDKPAVRLAGVYAMAGLADDWEENRQTCVDVLCAYLRMPYEPDPGQDAPQPQRLAFRAIREVRHTVIRVITAHLKKDAAVSWQGLNFDFTGVVFDGGDFSGAQFSGGTVGFSVAQFSGGTVDFCGARFSGGTVNFSRAQFSGGTVDFTAPSSPAARSASRRPVLRRHGRLPAPSSPAARSASTAPSSPAARSPSAAPSSPAARSTSTAPSSPAARSTSAMLTTGHSRPHSPGRTRRPRREAPKLT